MSTTFPWILLNIFFVALFIFTIWLNHIRSRKSNFFVASGQSAHTLRPMYFYSCKTKSVVLFDSAIANLIGWIGAASYLVAYLLLTLKKLNPDKVPYHFLNLVGAVGLLLNAVYLNDHPNMIINIAWGIIALFAIFLMIRKR